MRVKYTAVFAQSVKKSTEKYNEETARNRQKIETAFKLSRGIDVLAYQMNARRIK